MSDPSDTAENLIAQGQMALDQGRISEALTIANTCLDAVAQWPVAMGMKASILRQMGHADQSVQLLDAALKQDPTNLVLRGKLILALQGDPSSSLEDVSRETRQAWPKKQNEQTAKVLTTADENRPIKIAYISGDFREHPVAYFLEGVVNAHDRSLFEVHLVATTGDLDRRTEKLKAQCNEWYSIVDLSDEDAADLLRNRDIDIAIDLSGWTRGHRLGVFRHRAAPIQMTWIGYSGTTGLPEMDYIICDDVVLPPEHEPYYTETPLRLPGPYLSMVPPNTLLPDLGPRPLPKQRRILFGSFNTVAKLNDETIETWTEILSKVEGSVLILRARQFNDDGVKSDIIKRFTERGLNPKRLLLEGNNTRKGMLAGYRKVDIALDTFPYGGTTTTFEALCMGAPVITLKGDRWVSLVGASVLRTLELNELVAESRADYVDRAVALASDIDRLISLRTSLSERVTASPLCDTVTFTHDLETALREAWKNRCRAA